MHAVEALYQSVWRGLAFEYHKAHRSIINRGEDAVEEDIRKLFSDGSEYMEKDDGNGGVVNAVNGPAMQKLQDKVDFFLDQVFD